MHVSERRLSRRYKLRVPLIFKRSKTPRQPGQSSRCINLSAHGACFASKVALAVGELLEVRLRMPKRITGTVAEEWCFSSRVRHVERGPATAAWVVGIHFSL